MATQTLPEKANDAFILSDRQMDIETPEHVAIGYELADLGSRFTALLVDALIILAAQLGIGIFVGMTSGLSGSELASGLGMALLVFAWFLITWGYFVGFEAFRDGQTPGKRTMKIRVVHDGGYPLTVQGAAVRNLVRVIDLQPGVFCILGGLVMMLHPSTKRLGDLAAGTVVVRDRSGEPIPEEQEADPALAQLGPPRLSAEEFAALSMYAARRGDLEPRVRAGLAGRLMERVARHFADDPRRGVMSPDQYLVLAHDEEGKRRQAAGKGGRSGTAQASGLVRRQRKQWEEYRQLLDGARRSGLKRLDEARVSRFAQLYREVAADLARARTYGGSPVLLYNLERSVGSGHNLLYRPTARSWKGLARWATGGFPALARRHWRAIAVSSAFFYVPAVLSFAAVRAEPARAREFVPPVMIARAEEAKAKEARGEGYVEVPDVGMPMMATSLISNNVQVAFVAFAGGILAGVGTVFSLVFNGVHLGSVAGLFDAHDSGLHLWTFVLPHGVIELTAICIAGAAGLLLASALVMPGRMTRKEALVVRGRDAVSLVGGVALMLVAAGTIEGFVSPSQMPRELKLSLAALFATLMVAYLGLAGRGMEAEGETVKHAGG